MIGLSTYEVALRYACSKPHSVIKLSLPNNQVLSIAQNSGEYQVNVLGNSEQGTVEAWDGKDEIVGHLDGIELAHYILERAK